jgi:uncharacterized protein YjbI with pentapeptide repeats
MLSFVISKDESSSVSEQDRRQAVVQQRPTANDQNEWKAYWQGQGQPWRTEPEIDLERQAFLTERRNITSDWKQGIYPFKDIKLSRADVEWLLATLDNGRGPVDWNDVSQRDRKGLDLRGGELHYVNLSNLPLAGLQGGLNEAEKESATVHQIKEAAVRLDWCNLTSAHLEGANLTGANLWRADLRGTHLYDAHLEYADLRSAFFDETSTLRKATLGSTNHKFAQLADVRWGGVNLAVVNWSLAKKENVLILGDEHYARQQETMNSKLEDKVIEEYERAVRANRQLANALQEQGLNELAVCFAYRAQFLQRRVFRFQRNLGQYFFSLFLDVLAGYGYKPWRSFVAYLIVNLVFATVYFIIGRTVGPTLSPLSAWVFSMTSFHGRGFFPGAIKLDDPLTVIAAIEAFVGLLIEVTFIATLTQRLFGK